MKFLHTSDWHLGRSLYGRRRYEEFAALLDWLADQIELQGVDALLVAGDVFDTSTPSNRAQGLYYRFLCRVANSCCRNIVVIAGNHDSPTFLNAPKELLRALRVYVVGAMTEHLEDEVIVLTDKEDQPEAIVCAVPYLRDKDIRTVQAGETVEDKSLKLIEGLRNHYTAVCEIAEQRQKQLGNVPIIAMGHLFTAGGKTVEGDGVRELYVGSLAHVNEDVFPYYIDYLALGHLHVAQRVGKSEHLRYSGSPIPMGYGEASQQKKIVLVDLDAKSRTIQELQVPSFQELVKISGSIETIEARIGELKHQNSTAWLEIEYTGHDIIGNLRERIEEALNGSSMEVRRIKNKLITDRVMGKINDDETLDDLDVNDVFSRCLDAYNVHDEERPGMVQTYKEVIDDLFHEDKNSL
ncbi:MAG: exonuclease subunit SbcD [Desulfobulbaceae bacterium]|nr:exonuclease subunit SbcD [Desulfobulbaceae bacterium]